MQMPALPTNFDLLQFSLVLIFSLEIVGGMLLLFFWKKLISLSQYFDKTSLKALTKLQSVHDRANKLDQEMIKLVRQELDEYLRELPDITQNFTQKHRQTLKELSRHESEAISQEQNVYSQILVDESRRSIHEFDQHLQDLMEQIKKELQENILNQVQIRTQELSQEKTELIETQVNKFAQDLAKKVVHRSLKTQEQHDFVIKQIQQAAEQGILS